VCACLLARPPQNKKKKNEDLKHDKTKNKKNASKSQMVKNLKRERENKRPDERPLLLPV
jgi:hypothetical protein